MTERSPSAASLTRRAIARVEEGETGDARQILAEALELDPLYEPAWLWFAHIAESDGERRFCLEQAAAANPESKAKEELPKLRRAPAVEPPELADVVAPPPPPGFAAPGATAPRSIPIRPSRKAHWIGLAALGLLLALAVVLLGFYNRRETPLYIAVAGGMSGPVAASGIEMSQSVQLYFDRLNAEGGIDGRPVDILVFDDQNDPALAQDVAHEIVADGRPLLVIGHTASSASLAAGPIYAEAGILAVTSISTADDVTAGNPWYFRTVFDNRTQGFLIAAYIWEILGVDTITIVGGNADYGQSLAAAVADAFAQYGEVSQHIVIDISEENVDASIAAAVEILSATEDPGTIVLAMQADAATDTLAAIRSAGIAAPVLGGDAIGSNRFLTGFASFPEEQADPGVFTNGLMAASPLIMDSLTSDSLRWQEAFRAAYGTDPTWRGATTYDAAIAASTAMRTAAISGEEGTRAADRQMIRDALAALDRPENAVPGLLGPIYFDEGNTTPRPAAFGLARDQQYASAFVQLRPYSPSGGAGLAADLESGAAMEVEGQMLERQRVVFAGVNMNEIGELDTANPSFYADFFLWFNYTGDDSATDIVFLNSVNPRLGLGSPVRTVVDGDTTYQLYRVASRFKAPLEFQDFPFDRQHLVISFQNKTLPSSRLVYAVDRELLDRPQEERLHSGTNAAVSINDIPSWNPREMQVYQDTIGSTSLLGDPEASVGASGIEYSLFTTDITIERDLGAFLTKNLLPLALLAAVTYVSLYFPYSLTEARVTFGVTGILTTAVLLASVTSVLPQVGYTVAIEWGFYAFILLCAICIIVSLAGDWLYDQRRLTELRRLDLFARIFYPAFVLVVVLAYFVRFGGSA